jgi:uncharacterized protein (TIGR00251 family)
LTGPNRSIDVSFGTRYFVLFSFSLFFFIDLSREGARPMGLEDWCEQTDAGVLLRLQIQPRASKTEPSGPFGDPPRMKVRVAAPPVDGEANEELLKFLRKRLNVPLSHLRIVRGETSKSKDILVAGLSQQEVRDRLLASGKSK